MKLDKIAEVEENADLKKYNTYKIGGYAKRIIHPYSLKDVKKVLDEIKKADESYYILGNGSNVILPDEDYNGNIIVFDLLNNIEINKDKDEIEVEAGVTLGVLNETLLKNEYVNFYWANSIPGTLGGALVGNAGAYNHEIFEYLVSVTVIDKNGDLIKLKKDEIEYGYRRSNLNKCIVLGAKFKVEKGDVDEARELIKEQALKRMKSQPLSMPNAGSVFKNPEGDAAGRLIDSLGLKGYSIGGAMVSEVHANFIVNGGNATSKDIKELIKYIQKEVYDNYKIELELEQKIVRWN
jgi:UDP-N-acetylmuramate dehydrogenase